MLSRLRYPQFPEPIGVFRAIDAPVYDALIDDQVKRLTAEKGPPDMQKLLDGPDPWEVE